MAARSHKPKSRDMVATTTSVTTAPVEETKEKPFPFGEEHTLTGKHTGPVLVTRFTKDSNYVLSGGRDRTIQLWNPHKGTHVKEYKGAHGYEVLDIAITPDNARFASCGGDKVAFLWDVGTGNVISRYRAHTERINTLAFNAESAILVTGSYDKTVKAWDLKARAPRDGIQTFTDFKDSVSSVVVTDHEIIAASIDGTVRTWDLRMGKALCDHICHSVTSISLSNDGNCILMSCLDNTARLFDRSSGEMLMEYTGHKSSQYKIESCLTSNDAYVVSGSEDNNIYFWNLVDGTAAHILKGHTKLVSTLTYHHKDPMLVSGSIDGTIKVWK